MAYAKELEAEQGSRRPRRGAAAPSEADRGRCRDGRLPRGLG